MISLHGLSHIYRSPAGDSRPVVQIDDWNLESGEQALLRGVSGSGKTTLLNILAGLLHPTGGVVCFGEQSLYALPEATRDHFRARNIGYIFQSHHLLAELTALENVVAPLAFAGQRPRGQWRGHALALLESVGLGDHADYRPRQLSTGQRLRVAVARALVNAPPLVLADEPTAALDAESSNAVMDLLQATCRAHNATLICASHDPAVEQRFDKVVYLRAGHLEMAS